MKKTLFLASAITLSAIISTNSHAAIPLGDLVPFETWEELNCSSADRYLDEISDDEGDYLTALKAKAEEKGWSDEKYDARRAKIVSRYATITARLLALYRDEDKLDCLSEL